MILMTIQGYQYVFAMVVLLNKSLPFGGCIVYLLFLYIDHTSAEIKIRCLQSLPKRQMVPKPNKSNQTKPKS